MLSSALDEVAAGGGLRTVLHGGASGADAMAGQWARRAGVDEEVFPAQWNTYGKRAGFLRNKAMVDTAPDLVVAFIKNSSRGATMTVELANEAGIPVTIYREGDRLMDETQAEVLDAPVLNREQAARVEALKAARSVLATTRLFGNEAGGSVWDLISMARFILDGIDPHQDVEIEIADADEPEGDADVDTPFLPAVDPAR